MTQEQIEKFLNGLSYCAYEMGVDIQDRLLEDGFTEVVFTEGDDFETSIDFKPAGQFNGSNMLEVRATYEDGSRTFYISAIPYVLFGAVWCEV